MTDAPGNIQFDRQLSACFACGSDQLVKMFSKQVLGRHMADYFQCGVCGSLLVRDVHWLAQAYSGHIPDLDTGAAQRAIMGSLYIRAMRASGLVKSNWRVLDFGAGSGLLVRLLRDQGMDAVAYDPFIRPTVSGDFYIRDLSAAKPADLITAIEVLEHVPYPDKTLDELAGKLTSGGVILASTRIYNAAVHGGQWDYLSPEHGQHINFFSRKGLDILAGRHGLKAVFLPLGFQLLAPRHMKICPARRLMLFVLAGLNFVLARMLGLCRFGHALADNRKLAGRCDISDCESRNPD